MAYTDRHRAIEGVLQGTGLLDWCAVECVGFGTVVVEFASGPKYYLASEEEARELLPTLLDTMGKEQRDPHATDTLEALLAEHRANHARWSEKARELDSLYGARDQRTRDAIELRNHYAGQVLLTMDAIEKRRAK